MLENGQRKVSSKKGMRTRPVERTIPHRGLCLRALGDEQKKASRRDLRRTLETNNALPS